MQIAEYRVVVRTARRTKDWSVTVTASSEDAALASTQAAFPTVPPTRWQRPVLIKVIYRSA